MREEKDLIFISISMLLAVLILYYSIVQPTSSGVKAGLNIDKIKHFIAYALLSFSLYMSKMPKKHAFLVAGTYGLVIELIQMGMIARAFSFFDVIANYLGSAVVLLIGIKNGKRVTGKI